VILLEIIFGKSANSVLRIPLYVGTRSWQIAKINLPRLRRRLPGRSEQDVGLRHRKPDWGGSLRHRLHRKRIVAPLFARVMLGGRTVRDISRVGQPQAVQQRLCLTRNNWPSCWLLWWPWTPFSSPG